MTRYGARGTCCTLLMAAALAWVGCAAEGADGQDPGSEPWGESNLANVFVMGFSSTIVHKIDLLFMIDNSQSMAVKQRRLAEAVPQLLERLLNPPCFDKRGSLVEQPASPEALCGSGAREFEPIADVHVGVISSSLGGHGGPFCTPEYADAYHHSMEDMAHLMPFLRPGLESFNGQGFLAWDNGDAPEPGSLRDPGALKAQLADHVFATGEAGCGFEASLEAWYRFLIDPAPHAGGYVNGARVPPAIAVENNIAAKTGQVDESLLMQRARFLREDSVVAVIMLTDENDRSVMDEGLGHLVSTLRSDAGAFQMRSGTTVCDSKPNDACCISCAMTVWPPECGDRSTLCPGGAQMTPEADPSNLRCFDQKRRFGIDLLYPTSRYSVGLRAPQLCTETGFPDGDCTCERAHELGVSCTEGAGEVANPLYSAQVPAIRDPSMVFLAGIVGVPWQDIATDDTRSAESPELRYRRSSAINWG